MSSFSSSSSSLLSSDSSNDNKRKGGNSLGVIYNNDDKQFFLKNPGIAYVDGSVVIDTAYSDMFSDSMSLSQYNNYFLNLDHID